MEQAAAGLMRRRAGSVMVVVFSLDGSDPDPARLDRVMGAMLKMKKPVMAAFKRAYAG